MAKKPTRVTKKILKEFQEQVTKQNKRTRRDNAWFESLKPAEKRVAIARDVLAQLRLGRLVATPGTWLADVDSYGDSCPLLDADEAQKNKNVELQSILKKREKCNGCALGGMFMCAVERANKLKVKDLVEFDELTKEDHEDGIEGSEVDVDGSDAFQYLRKFFPSEQLELIESAFERGDGAYGQSAADFCEEEEDAGERMRLIMENIIVHKGKFVPEDRPVATFKTPGFEDVAW